MRTLDRWDFYVTRFLSDWTLSFFCTTFVYLLFLLRFCQCTFFCLTCFWIAILTYSLCVILWSKQAFISMHEFFVCFFVSPSFHQGFVTQNNATYSIGKTVNFSIFCLMALIITFALDVEILWRLFKHLICFCSARILTCRVRHS